VHLVTPRHFRSRDKDGGNAIRSVIVIQKPLLHANLMAQCFTELELSPIEVSHCMNRDFLLFASVRL